MVAELGGVSRRPLRERRGLRCTHCDQSVPAALVDPGASEQFCCEGCRTAHTIIHSCGLDGYYDVRRREGAAGEAAKQTSRSYSDFDDAVFELLYVKSAGPNASTTELFLSGVHCAACVWLVEKLPRMTPGVLDATLDFRRAMVRITWRNDRVKLSAIARTLDGLGYAPHPARDARSRERRRSEDRAALVRIAVAGACSANVMLFAVALYAGLFDEMAPAHTQMFRWLSMGASLIALAWPGKQFFVGAWNALRSRTLHLDVPIALALIAGLVWSVISTILGHGEVYFDTLSVLVFALLVGRFIQQRQQRWSSDAVELLFSLTPGSARRLTPEGVREVPVEALAEGDVVEVLAGGSFPADGEVVRGQSAVDQSLLTGESRPADVEPGSRVFAGSTNISQRLEVRVSAAGEQTRIGRLMRLVQDASGRRAPIVRFADRAAGWFTGGMLLMALVTFIAWLMLDPAKAVDHAVALLVVTCPCALGIATPLTLSVALGRSAQRGVMIKGGDAVQRLSKPGALLLDKTGTITFGRLGVRRWEGDAKVRSMVAALERHSSHPIAVALARDLPPADDAVVENVRQTTGGGIDGRVNGLSLRVGSPMFVREAMVSDPGRLVSLDRSLAAQGLTPVYVAVEGVLVAVCGLGDEVRPDARRTIDQLRERGWTVGILSGDHPEVVMNVADEMGIPMDLARGGLSPEGKLDAVRAFAVRGDVVMVGDGVNDTAALAAAGVGIAVHGGAEASLATADVYVGKPGLAPIIELIDGSRRTMRVVRRGLWVSTFYNVTAGTLAMLGLMSPILAAVVMPISSLSVIFLSLRSRSFGGDS